MLRRSLAALAALLVAALPLAALADGGPGPFGGGGASGFQNSPVAGSTGSFTDALTALSGTFTNLVRAANLQAGTDANGKVILQGGNAGRTGYAEFYQPSGPRKGYAGYGGSTGTDGLRIYSDDGSPWDFNVYPTVGGVFIDQFNNGTVYRNSQSRWRDFVNVRDFGAVCDGTYNHDDGPAINAALAASTHVVFPVEHCYSTTAIVGPDRDVSIDGTAYSGLNPSGDQRSSGVDCSVALPTCVILGSNNHAVTVHNFTVRGANGNVPIAMRGLVIRDASNVILDNVGAFNLGQCIVFKGHGNIGAGTVAQADHISTGGCRDVHMVIDSWAVVRVSKSYLGMNGPNDFNANAYLRLSGATTTQYNGPNTVIFNNVQFNQGTSAVHHWIEFVNMPSNVTDGPRLFNFEQCHVETVDQAGVYSDGSWKLIREFQFMNSSFLQDQVPFFAVNANDTFETLIIQGSIIRAANLTVAPAGRVNFMALADDEFETGPVNITGPATSIFTSSGTHYNAGLNLSGFSGGSVGVFGGAIAGSGLNVSGMQSTPTVVVPNVPFILSSGGAIRGDTTFFNGVSLPGGDGASAPIQVGPAGSGPNGGRALYVTH